MRSCPYTGETGGTVTSRLQEHRSDSRIKDRLTSHCQAEDSGTYLCFARSGGHIQSAPATLLVLEGGQNAQAPVRQDQRASPDMTYQQRRGNQQPREDSRSQTSGYPQPVPHQPYQPPSAYSPPSPYSPYQQSSPSHEPVPESQNSDARYREPAKGYQPSMTPPAKGYQPPSPPPAPAKGYQPPSQTPPPPALDPYLYPPVGPSGAAGQPEGDYHEESEEEEDYPEEPELDYPGERNPAPWEEEDYGYSGDAGWGAEDDYTDDGRSPISYSSEDYGAGLGAPRQYQPYSGGQWAGDPGPAWGETGRGRVLWQLVTGSIFTTGTESLT